MTVDELDKRLLNDFQRDFPLEPRPYATIANAVGVDECTVITALERLCRDGAISRIGPVFAPRRVGASTLAAMAVPVARLADVADLISSYPEVNHNYEREHDFNLWFVLTAPNQAHLDAVIRDMEERSGLAVMTLPLERDYHIDLGFPMELV